MRSSLPQTESPWTAAARRLAARVTRRARIGAMLGPLGRTLLAAAFLALLWRAAAPAGPAWLNPVTILVAGGAIGILFGARAAGRVLPTTAGDSAWALDRLANGREHGLAAAVLERPIQDSPLPPHVRLLAPTGTALAVGALLLAAVALVAPEAREPGPAEPGGLAERDPAGQGAAGAAGPDAAARAEGEATAAERRATAVARVFQALGFPPDGPEEMFDLVKRLSDPEARARAAEAAAADPSLAAAFDQGDTSPEAIARSLAGSTDERARAERMRREAVLARARVPRLPVPPERRDVVERYFELSRPKGER